MKKKVCSLLSLHGTAYLSLSLVILLHQQFESMQQSVALLLRFADLGVQ